MYPVCIEQVYTCMFVAEMKIQYYMRRIFGICHTIENDSMGSFRTNLSDDLGLLACYY